MEYCSRCVYPRASVNLMLDEHGVCSACQVAEQFAQLPPTFWDERRKRFERVLEETGAGKRNDNYDCIIPVSGGKDSYYQAHVIAAQYGLKPLLVTYHGNNYLPEGTTTATACAMCSMPTTWSSAPAWRCSSGSTACASARWAT